MSAKHGSRQVFSEDDKTILEATFKDYNGKPSSDRLILLSNSLDVDLKKIQTWFKNKLASFKRSQFPQRAKFLTAKKKLRIQKFLVTRKQFDFDCETSDSSYEGEDSSETEEELTLNSLENPSCPTKTIETVLKKRYYRGTSEFLVKWDDKEITWEKETNLLNFGELVQIFEKKIEKMIKSQPTVEEMKDSENDDVQMEERVPEPINELKITPEVMEERFTLENIQENLSQLKENVQPKLISLPTKELQTTPHVKEEIASPLNDKEEIAQIRDSNLVDTKEQIYFQQTKKEIVTPFQAKQESFSFQIKQENFPSKQEINKPKKTVKFASDLLTFHHFQPEIEEEHFNKRKRHETFENNKKMKPTNPLDSFMNLEKRFIPIWQGDLFNLEEKIEKIEIYGDSQDYHLKTFENISNHLREIKQFNIRYTVDIQQFQCKSDDVILEVSSKSNSKGLKKASERLISKKKAFVYPCNAGFEVFFFPQESYSKINNIFQKSEKFVAIFRRK